jgi:hypothetical protein
VCPLLTPTQRKIRARIAAHEMHAQHDARATTRAGREAARTALDAHLLSIIDPHNRLTERERERRLEHKRRAHFARLALKSAQARRRKATSARKEASRASA